MRTYDVIYRERGNKQGYEFCTTVNSKTKKEAREIAKTEMDQCYVVLRVERID